MYKGKEASGLVNLGQVRRVAEHIFASQLVTFTDLVEWVDENIFQPKTPIARSMNGLKCFGWVAVQRMEHLRGVVQDWARG